MEAGTNYYRHRAGVDFCDEHTHVRFPTNVQKRRARQKPARRRRLSVHWRGAAARPRPEARSRCGAAGADTAAAFSFVMGSDQLDRRSGSKLLRLRLWSSWSSSGLLNDAARVCRSVSGRYARPRRLVTSSIDEVNGLGTVQRCQNPAVLLPLHGGLPHSAVVAGTTFGRSMRDLYSGFEDDPGGCRYLVFEMFPNPCRGARQNELVSNACVECASVSWLLFFLPE